MKTTEVPYTITPELAASVTQVEQAFGTTRLLPSFDELPLVFQQGTGEAAVYHQLVDALFYGRPLPDGDIEMHAGVTAEMLRNCTIAHLRSFEPKHEYKIAGVAYMVSQLAKLVPKSAAA